MTTNKISTDKAKFETTTPVTSTPVNSQDVAEPKVSLFTPQGTETKIPGNSVFGDKSQTESRTQGDVLLTSSVQKSALQEYIEKHKEEFSGLEEYEIIEYLNSKENLTQEEQAILEDLKEDKANDRSSNVAGGVEKEIKDTLKTDVPHQKTELEIRAEQKRKEYQEVYSKSSTTYEKNSAVIDKYLMAKTV